MQNSPPVLALRARGSLAIFTEPAFKVERISYPVITPSAARGLIEAVLWKPAIRWRIHRIKILAPIRFTSFRRNEVNSRAQVPSPALIRNGGPPPLYLADEDRSQRNTVALADVDYVIEATFDMTERAGRDDNVQKFVEMFWRRIEKGQHFHQPYLGCRECPADVFTAAGAPVPVSENRALGRILWDIVHGPGGARPVFFEASVRQGIMEVPANLDSLAASENQGDDA